MQKMLAFLLIFSMISIQMFAAGGAPPVAAPQDDQLQLSFTQDQLENLVAPIALYPDPLLAQILLAATFPDQIDEASRAIRAYGRYDIDSADWDVSVKAVAHYPTVLSMMADKIDWTTSLGQAYVNQSTDVMDAIQHLRQQARSVGNLVTTPQQEIVETDGYIYIYPAQPQYIYVPTYDPAVVYFRRGGFFPGPAIWFSAGFLIGAWLNHDCDWNHHRVFYHGWGPGPVWVMRSRPYIRANNYYVGPRFQNVFVNRTVIDRRVNYDALNRYRAIHRDTDFNNVRRPHGAIGENQRPQGPSQPYPDNKIIRRNIDPNDARIDANRGRGQWPPAPAQGRNETRAPRTPIQGPVTVAPPAQGRNETRAPRTPIQGPVTAPPRQQDERMRRPDISRTQPASPLPQPQVNQPRFGPQPRPQVNPSVQGTPQTGSVWKGNQGTIDTRDASRRGQDSRGSERKVTNAPQPRAQNVPPRQGQAGQQQNRRPR